MANLIQDGMVWLGAKMKASATQLVTIIPASDTASTLTVDATVSPSNRLLEDGTVVTSYQNADFTMTTLDLVLDGLPYEPQRGDRIKAIVGGMRRVFAVQTDGGRDAWNWTDSSRTRMAVHTNDIGAQE